MTKPSGRAWCARFPTSVSVADLIEPFRTRVSLFLAALKTAGAVVEISTTYRPPERAWLMSHAWMVANGREAPAAVPVFPGLDIDWTHGGDEAAARDAAKAMVAAFGLVYRPSITSRHCEGRAIDMRVSWDGELIIRGASGKEVPIATLPRNGDNRDLHAVGAGFGVIKLVSDPPHWSEDGH